MKLFQGLHPYESVLLVLGTVLFAVLAFALVWYIVKEKKITALLPFFLLPVIMIGYPSIESISYDKGKLTFDKILAEVEKNPSDVSAREDLAGQYRELRNKYNTSNDPALLTSFAEAQYLLGNYEQAGEMANKAAALRPVNPRVQQIRQKINQQREALAVFRRKIKLLESHIQALESTGELEPGATGDPEAPVPPGAGGTQARLEGIVRVLAGIDPPANIDNESALMLAKALAITGNKESAIKMTNRVSVSAKDTAEAASLREAILQGRYAAAVPQLEPEQQSRLNRNKAISTENISKLNLRTQVWTDTTRVN